MPRVMVVDDDPDIRAGLARALASTGYEVETAIDGLDALLRMRERPPHALLTDVLMPRADGWSLIRSCRVDARLAGVRVLVMSGTPDIRETATQYGVDWFLLKPFTWAEAVIAIGLVLQGDHEL